MCNREFFIREEDGVKLLYKRLQSWEYAEEAEFEPDFAGAKENSMTGAPEYLLKILGLPSDLSCNFPGMIFRILDCFWLHDVRLLPIAIQRVSMLLDTF